MAKKLLVFALLVGLAAWAQHGRPGGGGPPGGMPGGASGGPGNSGEPGMSGSRGNSGDRGMSNDSSRGGPKSPDTLLDQNSKLSSKLGGMLPNGMSPKQACSGFKNLGQCVAAIHVAHNLGISFDDLKAKMTGKGAVSLGRAIQDVDPKADAKAEAKKAKKQADDDLRERS